ncbi:MAG: M20/M25/M40 family metallo-hydrolase [Myxococcales bacterium]|nr:M20/M25/M40 family metallo-hydrolase [Myxococcales bacterium]
MNRDSEQRRRRIRRVLLALPALLLLLLLAALINTLLTPSQQVEPGAYEPLRVDREQALGRLQEAVRLQTVSPEDPADFDAAPFHAFHDLLTRSFPRAHETLERELVADYSLMYRWPGSDPTAKPILLLAHMDVVPITDGDRWQHPPYAGERTDGFIWGRGTMDDKGALLAILEAVEAMITAGIQPTRTIYLCFGHNEERTGTGAQAMAALLAERGIEAEFAVDEGVGILDGIFPGMERPLAMVGIAEKGYAVLALEVEAEGGHSSAPPEHTAIGILAEGLARVEAEQMPADLTGPFRATLETAGPEMSWPMRFVTTNLWLFEPVLEAVLLGEQDTAPTVRTTTAVTVIEGGVKANVLPTRARALINHRLNAGDSIADVVAHVTAVVDDPRVVVSVVEGSEVSRISSADAPAFTALARALREVYPEITVAPGLFVAAADARHYEGVAQQVYRISPFFLSREDVPRYHGTDERLDEEVYVQMIQYYGRLLQTP